MVITILLRNYCLPLCLHLHGARTSSYFRAAKSVKSAENSFCIIVESYSRLVEKRDMLYASMESKTKRQCFASIMPKNNPYSLINDKQEKN